MFERGDLSGVVPNFLNDAVFVDAEDMAGSSRPDSSAPCLWAGDFGNNTGEPVDQTIYIIEEPAPEDGTADIGWRFLVSMRAAWPMGRYRNA